MISPEQNEQLTRVGRGTPMGDFMRQFWVPACLSSELQADGDPMRLMLLGEKLIAFRDTAGRVGIMDHLCPHRCASLFFGRNEEHGIRCAYHGWKFDVEGNCLDQPNLPDKKRYPAGIKATAYKTTERGGIVFLYMGARAVPPPLPDLEPTMGEPDDTKIALTHRECNWLQNLEGDIDTSHLGFLHAGGIDGNQLAEDDISRYAVINKAPDINVSEMPFGTMYSASRGAAAGQDHHRFACFVFPFWVTYPSNRLETNISANAWVPIDDNNTMIFNIDRLRGSGFEKKTRYKDGTLAAGLARPLQYLPTTTDWHGRWRSAMNSGNDYGLDRAWQRRDSFSGISGIPLQDHAIMESMGEIVDRSREHLASSDRMVMVTRRVLLAAALEFRDTGKLPAVLDDPTLCRMARGGDIVTEHGTDWLKAYEEAMTQAYGPMHKGAGGGVSPDAFVAVREVTKTFASDRGRVRALDTVSLTVERGEFLSVIGPSGCGKSTLLMLIAGLLPASSGSVWLDGQRIEKPCSQLGIVFQEDVLLEWRTALDNILLQAQIRKHDMTEARLRATQLLDMVGLAGFAQSYPHELSGGMRQRVSICRALLHRPSLLLMDEPFGALDALTRDQMQIDLLRLWSEQEMTALFVTHSITEAVFLSDRVVVMTPRPGRIETVIDIALPRPRRLAMRETPEFAAYVHHVTDVFKSLGVLREEAA